jgi:hypothetical protein
MPGGLSRGPGLLRLPGNLFRYVRLQAAEGQPRQISESLGEFLSGPLELSRDGLDMRSGFRPAPKLS